MRRKVRIARVPELLKKLFDEVKAQQAKDEQGNGLGVCPRCGERRMRPHSAENARSYYTDIAICPICGIGEAADSMEGAPRQFHQWACARQYVCDPDNALSGDALPELDGGLWLTPDGSGMSTIVEYWKDAADMRVCNLDNERFIENNIATFNMADGSVQYRYFVTDTMNEKDKISPIPITDLQDCQLRIAMEEYSMWEYGCSLYERWEELKTTR